MFRFTQKPSSGSYNQCLAKITSLVQLCVTHQVRICRHNSDSVCTDTHSWTRLVFLAKHRLWLPDDGSCLNQNMLERLL